MTDRAKTGGGRSQQGNQARRTHDGHRPVPKEGPPVKVQGGYQAPIGSRPAAPTTGSGVMRPAQPNGK
jgi:hypothetical protein